MTGKSVALRRSEYIHNYARTLAGQKYWKATDPAFRHCQSAQDVARALMTHRGGVSFPYFLYEIAGHALQLDAATQGKMFACIPAARDDNVHLMTVSQHDNSERPETGAEALCRLAGYSIIIAMSNNFWSDLQKARAAKE